MTLDSVPAPKAKQSRVRVFQSPSNTDRLRRILWFVVEKTLYRFSPNAAFAWRRFLLRSFGAQLHGQPRPYPKSTIWAPWNLEMHHYSCLANDVTCYNVARVKLGRFATVSQGAHLCSASHDFRDPDFPLTAGEIEIGREVWVAAEAFIGPGVTLHDRAVIGARAVVTKDVASSDVFAGNPAAKVGTR